MATRIIDADTHINEPPDLWTSRLPQKFLDRAPRVVDSATGKSWLFDNHHKSSITPLCNAVGSSPVQWTLFGNGYEGLRPGAWDPAERLKDMDIDMVWAHVLYPTYVLAGPKTFAEHDAEMQNACIRAYNDWLSEYASHAPERLVGIAILPVSGVDDTIAELTRVRDLSGIGGALLSAWPNGSSEHPEHHVDDRFWAAAADLEMPISIHVGFEEEGEVGAAGEAHDDSMVEKEQVDPFAKITLAFLNNERQAVSTIPILSHLMFGGVFERHPRLQITLAEVGAGWVPFFLEQSEDNFRRHRFWTKTNLPLLPSEYWQRQCHATFQIDRYAVRNRDLIGVQTMMWSSDYPHTGADWPNSVVTLRNQLYDVPDAERDLIVGGNAARLYKIDLAGLPSQAAEPKLAAVGVV